MQEHADSSTCFTCSTWFLQSEMPSHDDVRTRRHVKLRYCFGDNRPTRRIRRVRPPILRPSSCEGGGGGRALARNRVRTQGRSHSARDCERESDGVAGFGSHGAYYIKNFPRCVVGACRRPAPHLHLQRSLENAREQTPRKAYFTRVCDSRRRQRS